MDIFSQLNKSVVSYDPLSGRDIEEIRQQVHGFLDGTLKDIEVYINKYNHKSLNNYYSKYNVNNYTWGCLYM